MTSTEETVAKATENLDENLKPLKDTDTDTKTTDAPNEPEETDDPAKEKNPKDDEGFFADESNDTDDVTESENDTVETPIDESGLNPEQKYIVDNLPYMVARIKVGDAVKELRVKSWTQLPDDVVFASKRDELAFFNATTAQELKARELQTKFQQDQSKRNMDDFERRENEANRQDIAELQRAGELPKFKVSPTDPKFNSDPATKEVQKVLDFMNERNKQYLDEYNQGRPYRHIGFKEAFNLYGKIAKAEEVKNTQNREDKERREVAEKVGHNQGLAQKEYKKAAIKPGTRIRDLIARYEDEF